MRLGCRSVRFVPIVLTVPVISNDKIIKRALNCLAVQRSFPIFTLVNLKRRKMNLVERFLRYVSFDTQSDDNSGVTPSTPKQMVFAQYLKDELEALGLEEIELDECGYLYATLPANTDKEVPTIGFIAHMDTSPDMTGAGVTPRIVHKYDGSDIVLCKEENIAYSSSISSSVNMPCS